MKNSNYYIFAFATFGHPNDFRQSPFLFSNEEVAKKIKVFDLSNGIKVFPSSKIYSIRKESAGDTKLISYSIYTYAQEQTSKRDGTFIGSSIVLENKLTDEGSLIHSLNEFHKKLIEKNLNNSVLKVVHSNDFSHDKTFIDNLKLNPPTIDIHNLDFSASNKNLVIYCETTPDKLEKYFRAAVDVLNKYDTIYFTDNQDVAQFVSQKGIYKVGNISNFEQEIAKLEEERNQKKQQIISALENELQKIRDDRANTISEYNKTIDEGLRIIKENEEALRTTKSNLELTERIYQHFFKETQDLVHQFKVESNQDRIRYTLNQHKRTLIEAINQLRIPKYNKISNKQYKSSLTSEEQKSRETIQYDNQDHQKKSNAKYRNAQLKAIVLILTTALIFTWVYVIFLTPKSETTITYKQESRATPDTSKTPIKGNDKKTAKLDPEPNSALNEKDRYVVKSALKIGMTIEEITEIIFDKNPSDIKAHYKGKEKEYAEYLYSKNTSCFNNTEKSTRLINDSLEVIPSFKK